MKIKNFKKSIALFIIAIMVFAVAPNVFAEGNVAKIGSAEYATLADAVAAANEGDTIVLISDTYLTSTVEISSNQNITLDLNGKAITVQKNGTRSLYAIDNYGTFTLKDSVGGGSITARGIENLEDGVMVIDSGKIISCDTNGGAAIWNDADLTFNGGTLEAPHAGSASDNAGPGCINNNGGTAVINGGTIRSSSNRTYAIINWGGELHITNVDVYGQHGALTTDYGTAVIDGGRFEAGNYYGYWITNDGESTEVTINGGKFIGKYGLYASVDDGLQDEGNAAIVINGGEFEGTQKAAVALGSANTEKEWSLSIKGGLFSTDVSKYVSHDEGYQQYELKNGKFLVAKEAKLDVQLIQYYRVGEAAALNYEIENENEVFNKDALIFEKADANEIKEFDFEDYDFEYLYDSINNNAIKLEGDVVTALEPGVALVNVGTEGFGQPAIIVVYDISPNDESSEVDKAASEILLDAIQNDKDLGLTEEEATAIFEAIITGQDVTTEVVAEPLKEADEKDAKLIAEKVEEGQKLAGYYDISVLVKVNGEEIAKLRELGKKIKLQLEVSKDLPAVASGYTRTYSVIRVHDGKAEVIAKDLVAEDGKVPVETDKFSTYAVTYEDKVATNPKTGDAIMIAVVAIIISIIGIAVTAVIKRK